MSIDVSSAFRGVTTPLNEILDEVHGRGWEPTINWQSNQYVAKAKNPHGESLEATGPTDATAAGNLLIKIMRREHVRAPISKVAQWNLAEGLASNLETLAQAYAKAPVYDPKAAPYWKELADDSTRRAAVIQQQIKVEVVPDPEPYATPQEMCEDVHKNKHFFVSSAHSEHPVWTVEQNVAFRTVHDVMGHCVSGGDFGWQGELRACGAHFPLLTPNAQKALFVECIMQTGAAAYYRSFMQQKVFDPGEVFDQLQQENNPSGHQGQHPSQSLVPEQMPQVEPSTPQGLPWATQLPHEDFQGGLPVFGKTADVPKERSLNEIQPRFIDHDGHDVDLQPRRKGEPWKGLLTQDGEFYTWHVGKDQEEGPHHGQAENILGTSGDAYWGDFGNSDYPIIVDRLPEWMQGKSRPGSELRFGSAGGQDPNANWSSGIDPMPNNAYVWANDPLQAQDVTDNALKIDTKWSQKDRATMKQAIVNAFRVVLLSPRKNLKWNAIHYQDISHIPAETDDPKRYWDALESRRESWNQARGFAPGSHKPYWKELVQFKKYVRAANPDLDEWEADEKADREFMNMWNEEEERLTQDPKNLDLSADELERKVAKDIGKRFKGIMKPSSPATDYGHEQMHMFGAMDETGYPHDEPMDYSDTEKWEPGHLGKGVAYQGGTYPQDWMIWKTDETGYPHHLDIGSEDASHFITIEPDGYVSGADLDHDKTLKEIHPSLYVPGTGNQAKELKFGSHEEDYQTWTPGTPGKGFINNGLVYHWPTNVLAPEGQGENLTFGDPHHLKMILDWGLPIEGFANDKDTFYFTIDENGNAFPAYKHSLDEIPQHYQEALRQSGLTPQPFPKEHDFTFGAVGASNGPTIPRAIAEYLGDDYWSSDYGDDQNTEFKFAGAIQYDLEGNQAGKYGAFMGGHLKSISQISQHVDELTDAALEDVKEHDGTGHHFRAATLNLGISGVGPKVASFAWLLLQPATSQLATIDTHMMDVLGHDYEKEMNNRDYFKFERELAAGRDAAGYGHVPLGQFQWGMWDHKRTGPGTHQDHSSMKVLDPTPHDQVDWEQELPVQKDWVAPEWWQITQPARDMVADDWDRNVAGEFTQSAIPRFGSAPDKGYIHVPTRKINLWPSDDAGAPHHAQIIKANGHDPKDTLPFYIDNNAAVPVTHKLAPIELMPSFQDELASKGLKLGENPYGEWKFGRKKMAGSNRIPWILWGEQVWVGQPGETFMNLARRELGYSMDQVWERLPEAGFSAGAYDPDQRRIFTQDRITDLQQELILKKLNI